MVMVTVLVTGHLSVMHFAGEISGYIEYFYFTRVSAPRLPHMNIYNIS